MSLNGFIRVNDHPIASWKIVRKSNVLGRPSDDDVSEYEWTYYTWVLGHPKHPPLKGRVKHRYGDGARKLLADVMNEVDRALPPR
jgi:hypothetical protein